MTNIMQDGIAWLADRLKESAGQTATYRRGSQSVALTGGVWLSPPRVQEVGADGIVLERHDMLDVSFHAADLVLDGETVLPKRGDRIEIVRGTTTHTYEATSFADEPPYRFRDTDHVMIAVHATQVDRLYG